MNRYADALDVEAAKYLLGRGLTEETVLTARLGVVVDPIPAHDRYRGWLAIPYLVKGKPVRIRFRCLAKHDCDDYGHGKYGMATGERVLTYGVDSIHEAANELHVTEGEIDRLTLKQIGFHTIAFPGSGTWAPGRHGRMLAGFNRIYVWGDPDTAGAEFSTKITNRLPRSARAVQLKQGDINETFLAEGPESLIAAYKKAAA